MIHKNGFFRWLRIRAEIFRDKNGKAYRLIGSGRDITNSKINEDAMIKSIENFHNFFETIDDLIFIIDHTGKIMHTNRAVIEKLGYNEYELSGFTIYKLYSSSKQKKIANLFDCMLSKNKDHVQFLY